MTEENRIKLKVILEMAGVSYEELGKLIGVTAQSVGYKLRGKIPFKLQEAKLICEKYKIDYSIFLE